MDMAQSVDLDVTEDLEEGMDADGGLRVVAVPSGEEGAGLRAGGGRGDAVVREDGPPLWHRLQLHRAHRPGLEGRGAGLKDLEGFPWSANLLRSTRGMVR